MLDNKDYYVSYRNIFFGENFAELLNDYRNNIYQRTQNIFDNYSQYILGNYKEFFPFLTKYSEEYLKFIEENLNYCLVLGINLYSAVAYVNNIRLDASDDNELDIDSINKALEDEENRIEILNKYDISPVIEEFIERTFFSLIEKDESILDLNFKEVENLKIFLGFVIENSYIICSKSY
jgi:hypothetical protein